MVDIVSPLPPALSRQGRGGSWSYFQRIPNGENPKFKMKEPMGFDIRSFNISRLRHRKSLSGEPDRQHRAGGFSHDLLGSASEENVI